MKINLHFLIWGIFPLCFVGIISNGQPLSFRKPSVVCGSRSAGQFQNLAKEELVSALGRMTGQAPVEVQESAAPSEGVIYLGDTDFARSHGIIQEKLEDEEWLIRRAGGNLVITGGGEAGCLYGVYRFLNKQGCYFLTEDASCYPSRSISFDGVDERKKPDLPGRCIFDYYVVRNIRGRLDQGPRNRFLMRNFINGSQAKPQHYPYCGKWFRLGGPAHYHTYYKYLPPSLYQKHPEYFNMNDQGRRFLVQPQGSQPCLSNPEVIRIMTENLKKFIAADRKGVPRQDWPVVYDISRMDNTNFICRCPQCMAISRKEGSDMGLELYCINRIAEAAAVLYPEIVLRTFAYSSGELLPRHIRPLPNVNVQYCDLYTKSDPYRPLTHPVNKGQLKKFLDWASAGCSLTIWDYWNMGQKAYNYPPRPEVVLDAVIGDIRLFHHYGIKALFAEAEKNFMTPQPLMDLQYFIAYQLMVDSSQDAEKLIELYGENYYGRGWPWVRKYLSMLRSGVKAYPQAQCTMQVSAWRHMTPAGYAEMYDNLAAAEQAAGPDTVQGRRIREEMISPLWCVLYFWDDCREVFSRKGFSKKGLAAKCRELSAESLSRGRPADLEKLLQNLDREISILAAEIPVPEEFREIPVRQLKIFNYMHAYAHKPGQCIIRKDPESFTGWTVSSENQDPKKHGAGAKHAGLDALTVAVANIGHGQKAVRIHEIPADEKYHWYLIPKVRIGGKTTFWAHYWWIQYNLSSAFAHADGREELNDYDVWYSRKLTGPAYVPGSKKPNVMAVDQVILIRAGTEAAGKMRSRLGAEN